MTRPWSLGRSLLLSFLTHLVLVLSFSYFFVREKKDQTRAQIYRVQLIPHHPNHQERIVQTVLSQRVSEAKVDSYLGSQNQTVDRETVGRRKVTRVGGGSSPSPAGGKNLRELAGLGIVITAQDALTSQPTDTPLWATPGLQPEDSVPGVRESDRTALNTKEYVYYSYFQRIRGRLEQAWFPLIKSKLESYYQSGKHLIRDYEHTTKVIVFLNSQGAITHVQIAESSGTFELDEAAVAAFNEAGPFPNPPKTMMGSKNEIEIPWDFVLKS